MYHERVVLYDVKGRYSELDPPKTDIEGEFFHSEIIDEGIYTLDINDECFPIALLSDGIVNGKQHYKFYVTNNKQ